MSFVHDLTATPPPRYDGVPYTHARIEQSPDNVAFTVIDTLAISPVDPDPTHPVQRHMTTSLATAAEAFFRIVWTDAMSNESPPSQSVFSPSAADDGYPTLDALLAASSVTELTDDLDQDEQAGLRKAAIDAIEGFCMQRFTSEGTVAEPLVRLLDGSGADVQYLPRRLSSVASLSIDGQLWQAVDYTLAEEHDRLAMVSPLEGGSWVTRVRREPWDPGPVFSRGRANIAVAGVWGWTEDEWAAGDLDSVETALRFDMEDQARATAHQLAATVRSARALGLSEVQQGNLGMALTAGEPGLSMRAQRKLIRHRWQVPYGVRA